MFDINQHTSQMPWVRIMAVGEKPQCLPELSVSSHAWPGGPLSILKLKLLVPFDFEAALFAKPWVLSEAPNSKLATISQGRRSSRWCRALGRSSGTSPAHLRQLLDGLDGEARVEHWAGPRARLRARQRGELAGRNQTRTKLISRGGSPGQFDRAMIRTRRGWPPRGLVELFPPRPVPRQQRQQRDADHTDGDLHPDRVRHLNQHEVACEGQKNSNAEDFQGLLPAKNGGLENAPLEARPITGYEPNEKKCDDHEVDETIGGKIGLVVGIKM